VFPNYGTALDCAREIAGDPDLPPLSPGMFRADDVRWVWSEQTLSAIL
jgi:hypothetical protein